MTSSGLHFFIDFDGTISKADVVDLILDRFASDEWRKVEEEWIQGRIGSRECLSRQIALVSATKEEFARLITEVDVDPYFVSFLKRAKAYGIPVTIVSDGFKIVIEEVLKRTLKNSLDLWHHLPVFSNRLEWVNGRLKAYFPEGSACEHGCANCKSKVIVAHRKDGVKIVFVGDGLSDRFAAEASDLTFAKSKLLKYCEEKKINHKKYVSFKDIEEWIEKQSAKPYLTEKN